MDKNIFRNMSYGVYVVTTMDGMVKALFWLSVRKGYK